MEIIINPLDLTEKHILITGASSGIGKSAAIHLSKLGAKLTLIARNELKLKETIELLEGNKHRMFIFDLICINDIEKLIESIVTSEGPMNGIVHGAGVAPIRPLGMTTYSFCRKSCR